MEAGASGVVFFTAIPLAVLFIADGMGARHAGEVLAGLIVGALVGIPPLLVDLRARLRRG
jgi:hypothetical protein